MYKRTWTKESTKEKSIKTLNFQMLFYVIYCFFLELLGNQEQHNKNCIKIQNLRPLNT